MVDDVVNLKFHHDSIYDSNGDKGFLSGNFKVNYTNFRVTGSIVFKDPNGTIQQYHPISSLFGPSPGSETYLIAGYTLGFDGIRLDPFQISWPANILDLNGLPHGLNQTPSKADLSLSANGTNFESKHAEPVTSTQVSGVHANNLAYSSTAHGANHFIDLLNFEASYPDLIAAFGLNQPGMQQWYNTNEPIENRKETFDGLDYVASYADLTNAFRSAGSMQAIQDDGAQHFIAFGSSEGRSTSFNGLDYVASYSDLLQALGANNDAGAYQYIEFGRAEGRTTTFDGLDYIASYSDLIKALGANEQGGAANFIDYGFYEGRTTTFDGLAYVAQYTDLMKAFGANGDAGATQYIDFGYSEGRSTAFNVTAYESAHPDLIGKFVTNDAFLTAYINHYDSTGKFLT